MKKYINFLIFFLSSFLLFQCEIEQPKAIKSCRLRTCDMEMNIEIIKQQFVYPQCYKDLDVNTFNRLFQLFEKTDEFVIYKGRKLVIIELNDGTIRYLKVSQDLQAVFVDIETNETFVMRSNNNGNKERDEWIAMLGTFGHEINN